MLGALRKLLARFIIGLVVVLVFLIDVAEPWGLRLPLLDNLEAIVYDTRLRLTMPQTVDSRIVILDIDEKSLREREQGGEGHWPWPRDRLALLLDKLFDRHEVTVVGFDVLFAERDESSGIRVLEQIAARELRGVAQFQAAFERIRPELEYDAIFARKMKGRPVVIGFAFSREEPASRKGLLPPPLFAQGAFAAQPIRATTWSGYTANLEVLQQSAAGAGHINSWTDDDGVVRRVPMLAEHDGAYYEPLSLAVVRLLLGSAAVKPVRPDPTHFSAGYQGLEWLEVGPLRIPLDESASVLVPYRGRQGSFPYISIVDVMNDLVPTEALKGRIVLVGTTAPALFDLRATPVDPVYPGVEVHANMIAGMLDRNIKQRPPYVVDAEFVLLLASGLAMALLLPLLSPLISTLVTLAVLAAVLATNVLVFQYADLVLPLASGLVMILVLFTLNMAYGFFVEARGMRQITSLFGQYVPPELVAKMARDPEQYNMEPREADLTILFSDVRSFTTISEALEPGVLRDYINEYLTVMSAIIRNRYGGTLDKYIGDAIMAFWGAPMADPQHARNGVLAALDMQKECRVLNERFAARGWPTLTIGVGVNSGNVRVGDMGSNVRRAYTAMGDAVNIASRLEGITKQYGADIIIGEGTRKRISGFVLREVDRVRVKGRDEPVTIYEPLGLEGQVDQARLDEIEAWNQSLRLYRQQDWDRAEERLRNLHKRAPDSELYVLFVERIAHFRVHSPGAGWDGAWTFETK